MHHTRLDLRADDAAARRALFLADDFATEDAGERWPWARPNGAGAASLAVRDVRHASEELQSANHSARSAGFYGVTTLDAHHVIVTVPPLMPAKTPRFGLPVVLGPMSNQ